MRALVGLSGGADSAAVALRLQKEGHAVVGVFLCLFEGSDASAARSVAEKLGIEFHEVHAEERFRASVVDNFVAEYARGRTPNPCALCNREIKLQLLLEAARAFSCDRVVTGHYARVGEEGGRSFVSAGADQTRDQSYFLWNLTQEELAGVDFLLSDEQKSAILPEIQALLPEGTRESREVCFIPEDDRIRFLEERLRGDYSGEFVDENGRVLARHDGIFRYTVGQRRGFGVGFGKRVYVKKIDPETRRIVLADKAACETSSCRLTRMNFQKLAGVSGEYEVLVRVRYRAPLLAARLTVDAAGEGRLTLNEGKTVIFAPGQSAVLYDDAQNVLCGGVIEPEND